MPAIIYNDFMNYLDQNKLAFAPVYLIYGDEFLCKSAFELLKNKILPSSKKNNDILFDILDGTNENISIGIERLNTFSLLAKNRVVAFVDVSLFNPKQNEEAIDNDLSVTCAKDIAKIIQDAIKKGFPKNNHMIMTSDSVDKRQALYKLIEQSGIIIDCSVPKGDRFEDKKVQESILQDQMKKILLKNDKAIDKDAYLLLCDKTGFDLRTFLNGLEKLILYIGKRKKISINDVESLQERTKEDPVYELTNSIMECDIEKALICLDNLLTAEVAPLQILSAMSNLVRRLIMVKDFAKSMLDKKWSDNKIQYNEFKNNIMHKVLEYDKAILDQLEKWDLETGQTMNSGSEIEKKKGGKKKNKPNTDLVIAKNPMSSYPVYLMLIKSEKFTMKRLVLCLFSLSQADIRLKTTGQKPKLILEDVIFKLILGEKEYA